METRERTFTIRLSLSATIPEALLDDDRFEEDEWVKEWETQLKPALIRAVVSHLRSFRGWQVHIRSRGISPEDEIEMVVERRFALPERD